MIWRHTIITSGDVHLGFVQIPQTKHILPKFPMCWQSQLEIPTFCAGKPGGKAAWEHQRLRLAARRRLPSFNHRRAGDAGRRGPKAGGLPLCWDLHKKLVARIGAGGDGAQAHGVPAPLHVGLEISSQKERTRRGPRRLLQLEMVLGSRSTRFSLPFSPSGQMLSAGLHPALRHRAGRSPEHFFWGSAQLRGPHRGGEG